MGSFCGANSQQTTNSTTFSNPATAQQQNAIYGEAQRLYANYAGNPSAIVAPINQGQQYLIDYLRGIPGGQAQWGADAANMTKAGQGYVQDAAGQIGNTTDYLKAGATAAMGAQNPTTLQAWNPNAYMSPYTDSVVNSTLANFDRNADMANNSRIGDFIKAGNAFGGDRAGVALAEDRRGQSLARGQLESGLRQADFNQASSQSANQQQMDLARQQNDANRLLQSASTFGNLGGLNTNAGSSLGGLGSIQSAIGQGYGNIAAQSANTQASTATQALDAATLAQKTQQAQQMSPFTLLSLLTANSPGTQTSPTTTTNTYPGQNPLGTILGLGVAGASLYNNLSPAYEVGGGNSTGGLAGGGAVRKAHGGSIADMYASPEQVYKEDNPTLALAGLGGFATPPIAAAATPQASAPANSTASPLGSIVSTAGKFLPFLLNSGGRVDEPQDDVFSRYHRVSEKMKAAHGGGIPHYATAGRVDGDEDLGGPNPPDYYKRPDPNWQPGRADDGFLSGPMRNNATFQGALGILAGAGKRDQFGLPISPLAQIGQGMQYGVNQAQERDKQEQERYLRERQFFEEKARLAQSLAQQAAIATGTVMVNGKPVQTLAAQSQPSEIALREAQAKAAGVQSDKEFLLGIEKQKMEYQKQLQLEQQEKEWQLLERLRKQREQGANAGKGPPLDPTITYEQYRKPDGSIGVRPRQGN